MQPGERRIVWAYHHTSDLIEDNWQKHTENGFAEIALLKEPTLPAIMKVIDPPRAASSGVGNLPLIVNVLFMLFFVCSLSIL